MSNRNRSKTRKYRADPNPYEQDYDRDSSGKSDRRDRIGPTKVVINPINQVGLSVFRRLDTAELDPCLKVFNDKMAGFVKRDRSTEDAHFMALNLVALSEMKFLRSRFLGGVAVQEVIDDIWRFVPSIRGPIKVKTSGISYMGRPDSKLRPVALVIHEDDRQKLRDQRDEIIKVINGYTTEPRLTRQDWSGNHLPHITIGNIVVAGIDEETRRDLFKSMREVVPEVIELKGATIYNPVK